MASPFAKRLEPNEPKGKSFKEVALKSAAGQKPREGVVDDKKKAAAARKKKAAAKKK